MRSSRIPSIPLLWLLWILWLWLWPSRHMSLVSAQQQYFAIEPMDQTATIGEHVTLPCRVINKQGKLQWTKDGFGLGTNRNLTGFERYHMAGSDEENDFSLDINPVSLDEDAIFQCQVGPSERSIDIRSREARLTVVVPPEPPQIVQGNFLVTTEDREIELECISRGGKPAAEITWLGGDGNVVTTGVEYVSEPLPDGKRFTARSILHLTPKKEHNNKTFTCQADNRADRNYKSAKTLLEVKYAPKVSVKIQSPRIMEYDEVKVTCSADANPMDLVYKWYLSDQTVPGDHTTEFTIPNVSRSYHDMIVKCEVQNSVGKSEESETLDISYGPVFRHKPEDIQAELGSTVTLSCDVDGNPTPEITWRHKGSALVIRTSPNLTLTATSETAGYYVCQAKVLDYPEITAEARILVKGMPRIMSQKLQFGVEGDTVRIECVSFAIPKPSKVIWTHYGREVNTNDPEYSILEDDIPDGIRSILVVRESQDTHFGPYNCTVKNDYGSDVLEIHLKKQKSLPLLMILAGVIGCAVFIIAVTMVLILCQRWTKKNPEMDNSEKQAKQSDRSSNDSDLKVEIRTASSLSNVNEQDSEPWEDGSDGVTPRLHPVNGGDTIYRYSADYTEPSFPPKSDGHNNNGYVPYVDYSRDYNPPALNSINRSSLYGSSQAVPLNNIDPRYSATYGNPYLRTSSTALPPPPPITAAVPNIYSTRNGAVPQVARLPNSPNSQFILPSQAQVKPGTLATHV